MWILRNSKGDTYYLLTGKQHTVGRKDTDLLLLEDQSISRKHAVLEVEHKSENWGNPQKTPVVKLVEAGAKYGTSVISGDGKKQVLPANSTYILKDGDQIQFGLQWNLWRLNYEPLVVSFSTLSSEAKKNVKAVVSKLGGHVVDTWSPSCTHLTMCNITLTVKAVCALADGKPIVTPEMWNKYLQSAEGNLPLPSYEEFIPPLGETTVKKNEVSFKVNENRKTLFKGKKFLFFTRGHYSQHQCLVLAAGGTPVCLEDTKISKKELISPDIIVMQIADRSSQPSQTPSFYADYLNYLQASSKRLIPVSEIGLAVLHCSLDKYCNPNFSFASTMLKSCKDIVIQDSSEPVLAMDTQEAETLCGKIKASSSNQSERKKVIPASGTSERMCESSTSAVQAVENEEQQNTIDIACDSRMQAPAAKPCGRLQGTPAKNTMRPFPNHPKRPSDEELEPPKVKRQHIHSEEERNIEDLFAFASDKEEPKSDADLFSFVGDPVEQPERSKVNTERKAEKRKVPEDHTASTTPVKKCHVEPDATKKDDNRRNSDTQEDFILLNIKTENNGEEDNHIPFSANKTVVLLKDLVIRKPESSSVSSVTEDSNVENFKKFRKVRLPYQRSAPHIIGGKDLFVYETETSFCNRTYENEADNDEADEEEVDHWAFKPSQKSTMAR